MRGGETHSWAIGSDDSEVVVEGQRVPEGAFEARGGHAVEVDDGWRGTERIAMFAPGEGAVIREGEGLGFCCHCCGTADLDGIWAVSTVGRSYFRKFSSHFMALFDSSEYVFILVVASSRGSGTANERG
jgi:hypothetical protein